MNSCSEHVLQHPHEARHDQEQDMAGMSDNAGDVSRYIAMARGERQRTETRRRKRAQGLRRG
jgi:hypothetical protein